MKASGSLTFMGTGGSMGIPVIGCPCPVCKSDSPYNKRMRPSALLQVNDKSIVIDCGQEFRIQALKHHLDDIDGVIFTHAHHDHSAGIDDLRAYYLHHKKTAIPCLLSKETLLDLQTRYHYIFDGMNYPDKLTPRLDLRIMEGERGEVNFADVSIKYFSFKQTGMKVNGLRIGNFAYVSDIKEYSETIFDDLKGVETLVLSALRFTPSWMHLMVDEAVEFSKKVNAKQTYFTHIAHELDHEKTNAYLPSNIRMAYDGLVINF